MERQVDVHTECAFFPQIRASLNWHLWIVYEPHGDGVIDQKRGKLLDECLIDDLRRIPFVIFQNPLRCVIFEVGRANFTRLLHHTCTLYDRPFFPAHCAVWNHVVILRCTFTITPLVTSILPDRLCSVSLLNNRLYCRIGDPCVCEACPDPTCCCFFFRKEI